MILELNTSDKSRLLYVLGDVVLKLVVGSTEVVVSSAVVVAPIVVVASVEGFAVVIAMLVVVSAFMVVITVFVVHSLNLSCHFPCADSAISIYNIDLNSVHFRNKINYPLPSLFLCMLNFCYVTFLGIGLQHIRLTLKSMLSQSVLYTDAYK